MLIHINIYINSIYQQFVNMIYHTKETDMPEHLTFSERIALALKHADKKQVDLATACGVTRATVSK